MLKKIIVGVLLVTVVSAAGTALAYNAVENRNSSEESAIDPLASNAAEEMAAEEPETYSPAGAEDQASAVWQESGTILGFDDYGLQFQLQNGAQVYVELGPPDYWQNQGVDLQVGQTATIRGSSIEDMIHAEQISLEDGQILRLRTETGQPLWSGAETAGQGQDANQADGDHTPDPQAQVDDWVSLEGELISFQGGYMTMSTPEGAIVTFQTGQPRFLSDQGVNFQVGDEIVVVGFYENDQFMAGDITQVSSGLRVFLRDPNGRPLWAGPGSGNGNGGGRNSSAQ